MERDKTNSPQLIAALESGVSAILGTMEEKIDWVIKYDFNFPPNGTLWKQERDYYEKMLDKVLPQLDFEKLTPNQKILALIAWKNAWGIPEPPEVTDHKDAIIRKAHSGEGLTRMEALYMNVRSIDTDYF